MIRAIELAPKPLTVFEMIRVRDESGLSLTAVDNADGVVLEGLVYTDGSVAIHWRSKFWSATFFPDWHTFVNVHIGSHPTNGTMLKFYERDGFEYSWKQDDAAVPENPCGD